ncbi:hypothetical protein BGX26_010781 [Mortierella sp. AD094]|nr:hypothetical protein BGX26_010781 [Mortierella sp. AD094]
MADQAEILRKRREARQKKILASGESRLSKITGTAGTSTQVAPSPAVLQAREQLLKKEQEEERLKALKAAGVQVDEIGKEPPQANTHTFHAGNSPRTPQELQEVEGEELTMPSSQRTGPSRISRQHSSSSSTNATTTTTTTTSNNATGESTTTTTNTTAMTSSTAQDADADPDDSLGAPPAHVPSQQNPFMNFSAQHQQALTRMMQEDGSGSNNGGSSAKSAAMQQQQQQNPFGNVSPGFTVLTPQVDLTARWWKLLHFVMSVLLGFAVVYREHSRQGDLGRFDALATDKPLPYGVYQVAPIPVFWYFITMELLLQSTRMVLHGVTASPSSTLATIAGFLPPPFSDAIRVFMRYRLIWSSMVNDLSVVVFIVGVTIVFTHMFS